jgi:CRP-like cAMP-binding protein
MTLNFLSKVNFNLSHVFNRYDKLNSYPDFLWKIEKGIVKITTYSEDGSLIVLGLWGKGDVVSHLFGKIAPYNISCITKVTASIIPFEDSPELTDILLAHLEQMQELTLIRSYKRLDIMLVKLLQWLGKKFGQETSQGNLLDLRLTHQDIADILGSTRVPITKILNQLEQQGVIERLSLQRIILKEDEFWHYEI